MAKVTAYEKMKLENNEAKVVIDVETFSELTFKHVEVAERVLDLLGLDSKVLMDAVVKQRKLAKTS